MAKRTISSIDSLQPDVDWGASIAPDLDTDNTERRRRLGGFDAVLTHASVGEERIALWQVDDLERYVDRHALLAGDEGPEPPYWAHLWSGARVLAAAVPLRPGRTIELGCGLGLPGLAAARRGGRVTFVDRAPEPLAFVCASARTNGLRDVDLVVADFTAGAIRHAFDLVLVAEVLYDRAAFADVARAIAALLAPDGTALLADGARIDTRAFYPELLRRGLRVETTPSVVQDAGVRETIALSTIRRPT